MRFKQLIFTLCSPLPGTQIVDYRANVKAKNFANNQKQQDSFLLAQQQPFYTGGSHHATEQAKTRTHQ
jgi:lipoate-protein ligase B